MDTGRLLIKVSLQKDNSIMVTLGTGSEALLALALRKASLYVDEALIANEVKRMEKNKSDIVIPESILSKIG